jgi:hypothetical protein
MNRRVAFALLLGLVLIPAQRAHAQALTGKWQVQVGEWASESGGTVQMRAGNTGDLSITSAGDSIVVIFQLTATEGPARADTLRGTVAAGKLKAAGSRRMTARTNRNGEVSSSGETTATVTIDLAPSGETLSGTLRIELPGRNVHAPLTAKRAASN